MNAQETRKLGNSIELSLCPVCASQFYQSNEHIIRRSNPFQNEERSVYLLRFSVWVGFPGHTEAKYYEIGSDYKWSILKTQFRK